MPEPAIVTNVKLTDLTTKNFGDGADSPKSILPNMMNGLNGLVPMHRKKKKQEDFEMLISCVALRMQHVA